MSKLMQILLVGAENFIFTALECTRTRLLLSGLILLLESSDLTHLESQAAAALATVTPSSSNPTVVARSVVSDAPEVLHVGAGDDARRRVAALGVAGDRLDRCVTRDRQSMTPSISIPQLSLGLTWQSQLAQVLS